jgi:hypothetical protein
VKWMHYEREQALAAASPHDQHALVDEVQSLPHANLYDLELDLCPPPTGRQ